VPPRSLLALLAVQLLFGLHPVVSKLAFPAFGPGGVSAWRAVAAAVAFQLAAKASRSPPIPWSLQPRILAASMLGVVSNQLLFIYGLERTTAIHATLIIVTVPVATLSIAIAAGREVASRHRVLGIAIAFLGAALVVSDQGSVSGGNIVGDLMIVANAAAYGAYLVMSRDLLTQVSPLSLAAWVFTWGAPVVLLVTGLPPAAVDDAPAWLALGFVVLGPTIGTYFLNLFALRDVPASVVAVFVCLQPLVAALFARLWLGESLGPFTLVAGLLTMGGVILATRRA